MFATPLRRPGLASALLLLVLTASLGALDTKALPGTWTDAFALASLPDGSLLVAQRSGLVDRLVPEGNGYKAPAVWADLGDNGRYDLLGLAVDPDFLSSGYLYAAARTLVDGKPVLQLLRWRDANDLVVLNRVLLDNLPSGPDRTGGVLKFAPDGHLWLGIGDGGAPPASVTSANLRGVLLRLNEDGSIPSDNPDPNSPVWSWGYRDPGALAWQPSSGRLFSLDRGPAVPRGTNDRLDVVEKAGDYGWPKYSARDYGKGMVKAITFCSSGHSWVPNGAVFVTQGEWKGSLLFAGSGQGYLYRLTFDAKNPNKITFYEELINGDLGPLMDVALGPDGTPLLLSKDHVYRLNP